MTRKYCAVDAEGDAGDRGLLGVAFYSDDHQVWLTDHQAIRDLLYWHASHGATFVAHNMEYDLPVIWWQLGLHAACLSYNRTFNHGEWRYGPGGRTAQLWDSLNLAGGLSLAELGSALGLPKYDTPQSLAGIDADRYQWQCERHAAWECVECYALRDVEIVYRYMEHLGSVVGTWGATVQRRIGSTGQAVWRSLDHPEPIRLRDRRAAYLGRRAYYGGRVECFALGRIGPLYAADVRAMYPSVMLTAPFPDPAHMVVLDSPPLASWPVHLPGASECTVHVPVSPIPPLPNTARGERIFGTGLQRGTWTHLELAYALSLGCTVERVHRCTFSERALSPFTYFVSVLWEMREQYERRHDPRALAVKAMLNEAYGRFALTEALAEERIAVLPRNAKRSEHLDCHHFGAYGLYMCARSQPRHFERTWTNELWAATITAAARVRLHRALTEQGDALVYCDTDSVFSRAPIVGTGEGLGQLSAETVYERAWIVGPKLYRLEPWQGEPVARAKGIPRELADDFLAGKQVWIDRPISPHQMVEGKGTAGAWHTISRERRLVPYRRQPLYPTALESEAGWSPTVPPVFGPG